MIDLKGPWVQGFAFDVHTLDSVPDGTYSNGRTRFNTTRSQMGELVYQIKYNHNLALVDDVLRILQNSEDFQNYIKNIDAFLIVPPSNRFRPFQPVFEITKKMAEVFNKPFLFNVLETTNVEQIKNIDANDKYSKIKNTMVIFKQFLSVDKNYLIVDDVFDSGSTLRAYVDSLKENGYNNIFIFTLTKTRVPD